MAQQRHRNPHHGSDFNDFLHEDGLEAQATALALKAVISAALTKRMKMNTLTVSALARRIGTSRAVVQRALDPANTALTLRTLCRLAAALECRICISIDTR